MGAKQTNIPTTASVAIAGDGGRLYAPAASRNADALLGAIETFVPAAGRALEIASGTGEHIVRYASKFPDVSWQPTDIDDERLISIQSWADHSGCENIRAPMMLDATKAGWADGQNGFDLILLSNLLHLISQQKAEILMSEAARALAPGGVFFVYGPFLRGEEFASEGDEKFHHSLKAADPQIGYKPFQNVQEFMENQGLRLIDPIKMPANNLVLAARKI
ncbi:MAG: methyltransferase [Hyphomicrobiales bacterium]|nr:DUF938 domain-containing protein [Hyphomicrobiales bacterium]PCJ90715.1 MAG: methyltransferase [Hyphomicrobiales bacterium]